MGTAASWFPFPGTFPVSVSPAVPIHLTGWIFGAWQVRCWQKQGTPAHPHTHRAACTKEPEPRNIPTGQHPALPEALCRLPRGLTLTLSPALPAALARRQCHLLPAAGQDTPPRSPAGDCLHPASDSVPSNPLHADFEPNRCPELP